MTNTKAVGRKMLFMIVVLGAIFLAGCGTNPSSSGELAEGDVIQTNDEVTQGDFIFRLVSEKEEYHEGEEVKLYGEIEYVGELDQIRIIHSNSAIMFPMEEKERGYLIEFFTHDEAIETTLKQGVPYREEYTKSVGWDGDDEEDYVKFMADFVERDDFPAGHYVVNGYADFSVGTSENREKVNIEAQIAFKVVE